MKIFDKNGRSRTVEAVDAAEMVKYNGWSYEDPTGKTQLSDPEIAAALRVRTDAERRLATEASWANRGLIGDEGRRQAQEERDPRSGQTQADRDEAAVDAQRKIVQDLETQVKTMGLRSLGPDLEAASESLEDLEAVAKKSRARQNERDKLMQQRQEDGGTVPLGAAATKEVLAGGGAGLAGNATGSDTGGDVDDEFSKLTVPDLKKHLDKQKVDYASDARKADLQQLARANRDGTLQTQ